jgi:hypothetical protein
MSCVFSLLRRYRAPRLASLQSRLVGSPVAQHGIENPGQSPRQGHHRDLLPAAGGNPYRPCPKVRRPGIAQPHDRHRRLDQQRPHARVACFGEPPSPLMFPTAQLARHQAEVRRHLVGATKPPHVVKRGHKRRRGHRPHARPTPQQPHSAVRPGHYPPRGDHPRPVRAHDRGSAARPVRPPARHGSWPSHACRARPSTARAASRSASARVGWAWQVRAMSSLLAPNSMAAAASAMRSPARSPRM